jgi:hypothetical protein
MTAHNVSIDGPCAVIDRAYKESAIRFLLQCAGTVSFITGKVVSRIQTHTTLP